MHTWHLHFCTHIEILGPILESVRHREWRSIYGHVGSSTCLLTVKSYLEFSSFDDALSLVVPAATMLLPTLLQNVDLTSLTYHRFLIKTIVNKNVVA